jgi:hypothetical protein
VMREAVCRAIPTPRPPTRGSASARIAALRAPVAQQDRAAVS